MNLRKNIFIYAFFFALFFFNHGKIKGADSFLNYIDSMHDLDGITPEMDREITRVRYCTPSNIMSWVSRTLKLQDFFYLPFYKKTNELLSRPILDLTSLQKSNILKKQSSWTSSFFYNKYSYLDLYGSSKEISSYVNLDSIIDFFKNHRTPAIRRMKFFGEDIPRVVDLIKPFKIEERRAGVFFKGTKKMGIGT